MAFWWRPMSSSPSSPRVYESRLEPPSKTGWVCCGSPQVIGDGFCECAGPTGDPWLQALVSGGTSSAEARARRDACTTVHRLHLNRAIRDVMTYVYHVRMPACVPGRPSEYVRTSEYEHADRVSTSMRTMSTLGGARSVRLSLCGRRASFLHNSCPIYGGCRLSYGRNLGNT